MKRALLERNIVVALFVLVLVIFSFAERDTQKLIQFYNSRNTTEIKTPASILIASEKDKAVVATEFLK